MSRNYKSLDKFGINVQEKLDVLKNVKALRKDMLSMRINIEKKYRIVLDQMILKTSLISDDVNEANGICSLRNKMEKINTAIAKLKSISLDMILLAEFEALSTKWYYKLSRDIEGVRRYLISWQKYWIKKIENAQNEAKNIDDLYIPDLKDDTLKHYKNLKNKENSSDFEIANELFDDTDELIKDSLIKTQKMIDKIINHLIAREILYPAILPRLLDCNVASRKGLGTSRALKYRRDYDNYYKMKYGKYFVLKADVSKFFQNIDHKILKEKLRKIIKDKDAINILDILIDSNIQESMGARSKYRRNDQSSARYFLFK